MLISICITLFSMSATFYSLSYLYLILSHHVIDPMTGHVTLSYDIHDVFLHLLNMCSTCVLFVSPLSLLSSMIDMCLLHVAAQHMFTFHLPHVPHALTLCLPGCCLEDISIYSLPLYACNLTSHCCLNTNVTWYSLELFFLLNLALGNDCLRSLLPFATWTFRKS